MIGQGDLLRVQGISLPVVVVSNNFFNQSGMAVVCPIISRADEGPLHIPLKHSQLSGTILCEQVRYLDLAARRHTKLGTLDYYDVMDVSDAVMGIFEYI